MKRSTLIIMQAVGGITLLAYPMVLIAALMGLGSSADATPGWEATVTGVLLSGMILYPVIWALLWFSSWVAFRRGRPKVAALLSTPPLLVLAAFAGLFVFQGMYGAWSHRGYARNQAREIERVATHNPLLAAAMRFETGQMRWPQLEQAIKQADAVQLTTAVRLLPIEIPGVVVTRMPDAPPDPIVIRTPLGYLLERSHLGPDYDLTRTRPHFVDAARLLIARGATLVPEEIEHNTELPRMLDAVATRAPPLPAQ